MAARPITDTNSDGMKHKVTSIHATERAMDLAILKIDAKGLTALPLGDSDKIRQGQPIVALGNPLGLKLSVVRGIVSGSREIEGKPMIQLAVPIEEQQWWTGTGQPGPGDRHPDHEAPLH